MTQRMDYNQITQLIIERASKMAETGDLAAPVLSREDRKRVMAAIDETEQLWRAKKPLQRRSQTVLTPLMWQAITGIPPEQLDLGNATDLEDLMQPGFTPQWSQLMNIAAHSMLGTMQMYRLNSRAKFKAAIQLPLTALFIYMSARRFGAPSVFDLREGLADKLILTDADDIKPRDIQPPLPGFYVQMPPGALEMWNVDTGWHKVSFVGIGEGRARFGVRAGRVLMSIFWGEPNERSKAPTDDNAQVSFLSLPEEYEGSVEEYEASLAEGEDEGVIVGRGTTKRPFVRWQGTEFSYEDGHRVLRKFVMNFCLYLSSPNPDIQPTGSKQSWREVVEKAESARQAGPHAKRQVTIGKNFAIWDVGRNVRHLHAMTATDILVRGHWRRQPHGPRWSLRKVIWVEPHIRLATGGETEGHEYAVEDRSVKPNARIHDVARTLAEALTPALGARMANEVANNAALPIVELDEPAVVVISEMLRHRLKHQDAGVARENRDHELTPELIDAALTTIEDLDLP